MIKFPNFNDYVSLCNNSKYKFGIRIDTKCNTKDRKGVKTICFNISFPIPFSFLKDILERYCLEKDIPVNIYEVDVNTDFETISFWKLIWFLDNIVEYKRVLIKITNPDDKEHYLLTSIYINDKEDFDRLKKEINRFYDKDFDGIVD